MDVSPSSQVAQQAQAAPVQQEKTTLPRSAEATVSKVQDVLQIDASEQVHADRGPRGDSLAHSANRPSSSSEPASEEDQSQSGDDSLDILG